MTATVRDHEGGPSLLARALFDRLDAVLHEAGRARSDIVRSRMFAPTREARDSFSLIRSERLKGDSRCATSSYIDTVRCPDEGSAAIEAILVDHHGLEKLVAEYRPPQVPCRFVALGDEIWFSGLTSVARDLAAQLDDITTRLEENRRVAEDLVGADVMVVGASTYLSREVAIDGWPGLPGALLPYGDDSLVALRRCDGFSSVGKLVEVEIDAATR